MKNGIVRKIDNLGRIVIPKEIRNILGISDFDDLSIFCEDDKIIIKRYQKFNDKYDDEIMGIFSDFLNGKLYLCNNNTFIGNHFLNSKRLPESIMNILKSSNIYKSSDIETLYFDDTPVNGYFYYSKIFKNSNDYGGVLYIKDGEVSVDEQIIISILTRILGEF